MFGVALGEIQLKAFPCEMERAGCWGGRVFNERTDNFPSMKERRYAGHSLFALEGFSNCLHAFPPWRSVNKIVRQLSKQGAYGALMRNYQGGAFGTAGQINTSKSVQGSQQLKESFRFVKLIAVMVVAWICLKRG